MISLRRTPNVFGYGISIASLLPYAMRTALWAHGSPMMAAKWAQKAGYEFLQVLPLRGVTGRENWPLPVKYHEGAWNPVNGLLQGLRHQIGGEGMPSTPIDWAFFPKIAECRKVEALLPGENISHHLAANGLYEVNPDDRLAANTIARYCRDEGCRLVIDTEHLLRADRNAAEDSSVLGATRTERHEAVKVLAPYVAAVHVKSVTDSGSHTIVENLLSAANRPAEINFVAEYKPKLGTPSAVQDHMAWFLANMKMMVERYA